MTKPKTVQIKVNLPLKLIGELEPILLAKNISLDEAVRLYLRSMVTGAMRGRALTSSDEMPIGKFRGEPVELVIRADAGYVAWLVGNVASFKLSPEMLQLLEDTLR